MKMLNIKPMFVKCHYVCHDTELTANFWFGFVTVKRKGVEGRGWKEGDGRKGKRKLSWKPNQLFYVAILEQRHNEKI